jgi:hypothetical protein
MRGGLEFMEYLRVGCCNPVEELGEFFIDVPGRAQLESHYVELALNQAEVVVGHVPEFLQSADVE